MKEYLESKKKKEDKKGNINELRQKVSNDLSIDSSSSNQTTKFYKKIIEAQEFELEVHNNKKSNDDVKIEEPSDSDDDDLDRQ